MGRRAALRLLGRMDEPGGERSVEVLEPELVVRGSTAPR
jgi:DNA-binding LacI/PurR family transcriptional regulator